MGLCIDNIILVAVRRVCDTRVTLQLSPSNIDQVQLLLFVRTVLTPQGSREKENDIYILTQRNRRNTPNHKLIIMKDKDTNSVVIPRVEETGISEARRDEDELAKMGYKQELKCVYSLFS
jgi:hypothetical protein